MSRRSNAYWDFAIIVGILTVMVGLLIWPWQTDDMRLTWRTALSQRLSRCVVQINVNATPLPSSEDEDYPRQPQRWCGSGTIISADGKVLSAYHVLGMQNYTITAVAIFADGHKEPLKILKLWPDHDLSLAQLPARKLPRPFVKISTRTPVVGEDVLTFGNPFALGLSPSSGILTARNREITLRLEKFPRRRWVLVLRKSSVMPSDITMDRMLQFDAPLNPGNSGGGLFNRLGELIGQTNAGVAGDGIGFAVPASYILAFLRR